MTGKVDLVAYTDILLMAAATTGCFIGQTINWHSREI